MLTSRRAGNWTIRIVVHAILILGAVFMLLPFVWMLSTSLKTPEEVFGFPPRLIPEVLKWSNYTFLIQERGLLRIVGNTAFVAGAATLLRLFFCALGGYGFAKFHFPGRDKLFLFLLATMLVPGAVTLVPIYVFMRELGWIDTFWPLIVPGMANAFGVFFMRQYISTLSDELLDAARIDGCSEFGIFRQIVLPIIAPGLTSLGLIFFMGSWNDYFGPLVFLKSRELFTIPLAIASFQGQQGLTDYNAQMAMSVISLLPLLIIFVIFQRRLVEGITAGAIRG